MRNISKLPFAFSLFVAVACNACDLPDPSKYPAEQASVTALAKPIIKSKLTRIFRTRITEGAKSGPNFAGHYTVVRWGCGAGAFMFVVVDSITGKIYEPPESCIALAGDERDAFLGSDNYNPSFSLNSKLLLTVGVVDGPKDDPYGRAKTVYLFDKGTFKKIYKAHAELE